RHKKGCAPCPPPPGPISARSARHGRRPISRRCGRMRGAHRPPPLPEAAYLWSWDKIRPLISAAIDVASPEVVERRVLQLVPPVAEHQGEQQTSRTLSANIQILLPGEKARPHRHTMNALRFVLEGSGATTIVDGKPCPMEEGDLIVTPSWTW